MKRLSDAQRHMLRRISQGYFGNRDEPHIAGNTNRTTAVLHQLGLIAKAPDQFKAQRICGVAWVLTDAGRETLK